MGLTDVGSTMSRKATASLVERHYFVLTVLATVRSSLSSMSGIAPHSLSSARGSATLAIRERWIHGVPGTLLQGQPGVGPACRTDTYTPAGLDDGARE